MTMSCDHDWFIAGREGPPETGYIGVYCCRCGVWGYINPTSREEYYFVGLADDYGFLPMQLPTFEGQDDFWTSRVRIFSSEIELPGEPDEMGVTLRLTRGQTSLDGDPLLDDEYEYEVAPMISDLVNALFLFEGDNDDIPF